MNKAFGCVILIMFLGASYAENPEGPRTVWQELDLLDSKKIPEDVDAALAQNDFRLAAVLTGTESCRENIPGVKDKAVIIDYGVKIIVNLCGDVITNKLTKRQLLLTEDAMKYAETYNLLLQEKLKTENRL